MKTYNASNIYHWLEQYEDFNELSQYDKDVIRQGLLSIGGAWREHFLDLLVDKKFNGAVILASYVLNLNDED